MTNAQAAPQISYDHGVSDRKLIGETIGAFFDRQVSAFRDREALVLAGRGANASGVTAEWVEGDVLAIWPPIAGG